MTVQPAARVTDLDACPHHGPNPVVGGSLDVWINGLGAARLGDPTSCGDRIAQGQGTILINGRPIAHVLCVTVHGGSLTTGSPDVFVGSATGGPYSAQFRLRDPMTGEPVRGASYRMVSADGGEVCGCTDEAGLTRRIMTAEAARVQIFLLPHALADDEQDEEMEGC